MSPCLPNTIYCGFIICFTLNGPQDKLAVFFKLMRIESALLSQSSGSTLKNLSQHTLKAIHLAVHCDRKIIERFNDKIEPQFAQIKANDQQNRELAQLRDWLLPLLMNGQVRMR